MVLIQDLLDTGLQLGANAGQNHGKRAIGFDITAAQHKSAVNIHSVLLQLELGGHIRRHLACCGSILDADHQQGGYVGKIARIEELECELLPVTKEHTLFTYKHIATPCVF